MRMIDLVFKDLKQIFRDRRSILFLVAMPIAFTCFMGFVYGLSSDDGTQDARLSLVWVESGPATAISRMLYARLEQLDAVKTLPMRQEEALALLEREQVDGVLVVPAGFDQQVESHLTAGQPIENPQSPLRLIADPASSAGKSLQQRLRMHIFQLISAVKIGQLSAGAMGEPQEFSSARKQAWAMWGEDPSRGAVRLEGALTQEPGSWFGDNPYNQASPGILVQFAIMGLVTSAQILVRERKSRTLQRQKTTALRPWEILVGHWLALFVVVFLQTALLIVFGQLLLDVGYLRDLASVLLVAVTLGLWVSSMGLLIGLLASQDDQVILYSMIAMFTFSALGGAWFPVETAGKVFATLGKILPSAWAMQGFQNVLLHGSGFSSSWGPAGILLAYALGFILISTWYFRRMEV